MDGEKHKPRRNRPRDGRETDEPAYSKVADDDVWFDIKSHPGTKAFKRAVCLAVEDYGFDAEYSKSIVKYILKELEDEEVGKRRQFYYGQPPKPCSKSQLMFDLVGSEFEKEKARQKRKKRNRSLRRSSSASNLSEEKLDTESRRREHKQKRSSSQPNLGRESDNREIFMSNSKRSPKFQRRASLDDGYLSHIAVGSNPRNPGLIKKVKSMDELKCKEMKGSNSSGTKSNRKFRKGNSFGSIGSTSETSRKARMNHDLRKREPTDRADSNRSNIHVPNMKRRNSRESCIDAESCDRADVERRPTRRDSDTTVTDDTSGKSRYKNREASTSEIDTNYDIFLEDQSKPGTLVWQETIQKAAIKFCGIKSSSEVFDWIMREVRGRKIYSSMSQRAAKRASTKELKMITIEAYNHECHMLKKKERLERYMKKVNKIDVYFEVPDHPGTMKWKQLVEEVAIKFPNEDFSKSIFKLIRRKLSDSKFYSGEPPGCEEATNSEIVKHIEKCFDHAKLKQRSSKQAELRSISMRQKLVLHQRRPRPTPGNLYWVLLHRNIKSLFERWAWYQRTTKLTREFVESTSRVIASRPYLAWYKPYWLKINQAIKTDPRTGNDFVERVASKLKVKFCGYETLWPSLLLIGLAFSALFFISIQAIMTSILFRFIK